MEKILLVLLQLCSFILLAPLVQGVIKKVKARLQNRIGADLFQPYRDILKYLKITIDNILIIFYVERGIFLTNIYTYVVIHLICFTKFFC